MRQAMRQAIVPTALLIVLLALSVAYGEGYSGNPVFDATPGGGGGGGSGDITSVGTCNSGPCNQFGINDGYGIDMSAINCSSTTEGLALPQSTTCAAATKEGQVCWDTDDDMLYIGDNTNIVAMGADNLGNHTATQDVDMKGYQIIDSSTYLNLGVAGASSAGMGVNDVLFGAQTEFNGAATFDALVTMNNGYTVVGGHGSLYDDKEMRFGSGNDAMMTYSTANTVNTMVMTLSQQSRNIVICEDADSATDWGHAQQTNPTLYIQSADATSTNDFISFSHNQTDAVIDAGAGDINLQDDVEFGGSATVLDDNPFILGNNDDATFTYDGTDLNINPKAVGSGSVVIEGDIKFEGQTYRQAPATLGVDTTNDDFDINWALYQNAVKLDLADADTTANTVNAPTNAKAGAFYTIYAIQDSTTNTRTLTWNSVFKFAGSDPTLTTGSDAAVDVHSCHFDGSDYYCSVMQDMK